MYIKDLDNNLIMVTDLDAAISEATLNVSLSKIASKDKKASVKFINGHPIEEFHTCILNQLNSIKKS